MTSKYDGLKFTKEIGSGSYGKVFLGMWRETKVAIKLCNELSSVDQFLDEATLMIELPPHPNVVQILAVSVDGPYPAIILEFCQNGSLDKLLFDNDRVMTIETTLKLVGGIARGMLHLHQNNIVHRDLAARNILLHQSGDPKISDFGMSRFIKSGETGQTKAIIGPIRWMAPESLALHVYSQKSDVWSFGIVVYEIVARREPHAESDPLTIGGVIRDKGFTPTIPDDCEPILKELMESCWQKEVEKRPDFQEILWKLNQHPFFITTRSRTNTVIEEDKPEF